MGAGWRLIDLPRNPDAHARYNPAMAASYARLHQRYRLQAKWTASIRRRLLAQLDLLSSSRLLEVGSGTGVITGELSGRFRSKVFGVDIDRAVAAFAAAQGGPARYAVADGAALPFPTGVFDGSLCHFLLLWVDDPKPILLEMIRVTRSGGRIMALAEPDYRGRIDHPVELERLGAIQARALSELGANLSMGRELRAVFGASGLVDIQAGVLGGEWSEAEDQEEEESEWEMLQHDVCGVVEPDQLASLEELVRGARRANARVLFVPTFYAAGRVA